MLRIGGGVISSTGDRSPDYSSLLCKETKGGVHTIWKRGTLLRGGVWIISGGCGLQGVRQPGWEGRIIVAVKRSGGARRAGATTRPTAVRARRPRPASLKLNL